MSALSPGVRQLRRTGWLMVFVLAATCGWSQKKDTKAPDTPAAAPPPSEASKDTLGRNTPRGTVLGFLNATRKNNGEIAALYLNTPLRGQEAQDLAYKLGVVIDRRLPARLNDISELPEGSAPDPLHPDEDVIGTIITSKGDLDIVVERVDRGKAGKVWLFSRKTLNSIPEAFQEIATPPIEALLPQFLVKNRIGGIPLFQWLAVFLGMPLLYLVTGLLNPLLRLAVGPVWQRIRRTELQNRRILPVPIRLLLVALAIRWTLSRFGLSFLARQFWSTLSLFIFIAACVWLLMLLNAWGERHLLRLRGTVSGSPSVLRLARRLIDVLLLFAGLLFVLHHFDVNLTAAMAGLGVGGIAVALAAQKTLENVIAGVSIIADQAVRVGDTLKVGEIVGMVEEIGLRSTRIRTLDRTVVSVPNGQIANLSLETLSVRDKFWFHPVVGLRYETAPDQLRAIVAGIQQLLGEHRSIESASVRVRFIRLGAFSLDIEIFSYIFARDWNEFLSIQEELLLHTMEIVQRSGAQVAFPSQTMYLANDPSEHAIAPALYTGKAGPVHAIAGSK